VPKQHTNICNQEQLKNGLLQVTQWHSDTEIQKAITDLMNLNKNMSVPTKLEIKTRLSLNALKPLIIQRRNQAVISDEYSMNGRDVKLTVRKNIDNHIVLVQDGQTLVPGVSYTIDDTTHVFLSGPLRIGGTIIIDTLLSAVKPHHNARKSLMTDKIEEICLNEETKRYVETVLRKNTSIAKGTAQNKTLLIRSYDNRTHHVHNIANIMNTAK